MDEYFKNYISSTMLSIDYSYDHGVFLTTDGEFDNIHADDIEDLKEYLTPDKYSILHCDLTSDIVYVRKSILHDSQYNIRFLRQCDIFYLNKPLCNIALVYRYRKDVLMFLLEYNYKINESAINNLRLDIDRFCKNHDNVITQDDLDLFMLCKQKNDFSDFRLLIEVI
jgi:hypothetical protein